MDCASQEQRLELYLQEQHRLKGASHFPSEDGCTMIVLVLLDQLGEAAHFNEDF